MLLNGVIIKGYSGFYYVRANGTVWICSLRGRYRVKKQSFLPGDRVRITAAKENKGVIEAVEPRRNELTRPPIANIDRVVVIMALSHPQPDLWLLDRLLINALAGEVEPVLCFNKADLVGMAEQEEAAKVYGRLGFPFLITSTKTGQGIAELQGLLTDKISVFAGPSGVGKSSLLNALEPQLTRKTGDISEKLARGKHTTRHVELLALSGGGLLADTPGFSQAHLPEKLKREELKDFYPDFAQLRGKCKFKSCLHKSEPQCAVREAVQNGGIDPARYERYLSLLEEVIEEESRY